MCIPKMHPPEELCAPCCVENCKYAHAVPKADGSEHARKVARLLEVTALVNAAHKAGQSLMPKPQSAGRTGAHLGSGSNPKSKKARK
mmetsp:Transcript_26458/g.67116  ORF Transcript_26458/g.67116 Transcript_26458/m.67116 type:complete len:87 (-) Transcript_26458:8-268(-)